MCAEAGPDGDDGRVPRQCGRALRVLLRPERRRVAFPGGGRGGRVDQHQIQSRGGGREPARPDEAAESARCAGGAPASLVSPHPRQHAEPLRFAGLLEATFTQDYLAALKTDWLEAAPAADAPKGGGGDGEINPAVAAKAKQLWKLLGGGTPTDGAVIGVELATSEGSSLGEFVGPQGRVKFETVPEELAGISQPMALLRPWLQELAVAAGSPQGQPFNLSIEQFVGWFDGELKAAAADSWAAGGTAVIPMPAAYFRCVPGRRRAEDRTNFATPTAAC